MPFTILLIACLILVAVTSFTAPILALAFLVLLGGSFLLSGSLRRQVIGRSAELEKKIAEHKQSETALQESEARYVQLFENSPIPTLLEEFSKDRLKIIDANQAAQDLLGWSKEEMKTLSIDEIVPPEAMQAYQKLIAQLQTQPRAFTETFSRSKEGNLFPVRININTYSVGGSVRAVVTIEDISGRKRAEEEKTRLEKQLRHAQKLETIGTLAGGIAHDFNNILAPIMGFTEMALLDLEKTDPVYANLEQVLSATHRARELVGQILLFSKQTEREHQPLSLQLLLKEVLKLLRPSIPATIDIREQIDDSCGNVWADATQIHQVIVNLCTNAWHAMEKEGGTLSIELKRKTVDTDILKLHPGLVEDEYACLSIIDTGHGMDAETRERMFEPFYTTKEVDKGSGLGLSVVHGIVQSHKGDILVDSEPGKGTTFHVYLPLMKPEENSA